jgi:hypothetical protein
MSRKDDGKGMLPVREQARMAWNAFRWVYWPKNQPAWLSVLDLILVAVLVAAVAAQLWLVLLACFFLWFAAGAIGRSGL